MKVRFYQFSKRNKSTKLPDVTYVEKECYLKDGASLIHPTLLLQTFEAAAYNYIHIPKWNRYYFISDAMQINNMWEVSCTEDYLASFKASIGVSVANVLYATGSNKSIVDSRIPVKSSVLIGHTYEAIPNLTITEGSGAVIIGLTGKGSFGTYLMQNSTEVSELLDGIEDWASFITDNWTFTKQLFFGGSASECLRSAIAIPIVIGGPDVSSSSAEDLSLGNYPCTDENGNAIKGYKINKPIVIYSGSISIPWQSTDWKKVSAYTSIKMYLPFIGIISIPATEVQDDSSLSYNYSINVTSGDISVEIYGSSTRNKIATASGNCAMNTAYGSTGIDTSKLTSAVATGLGTLISISAAAASSGVSLATEAAIGAGIGATALQTVQALGGNSGGSGGLGGGSSQGLDKVVHVFVIQKELTDSQVNFDPIIGKPYMGIATIGSFNGFVQTDGFQFESNAAYSSEKDMINKLLDTGIYFE